MPARHAPPLRTRREPAAPVPAIAVAVACVVLAVQGCASVAPRAAAPYPVEVPEAWSITGLSAAGGRASMAQWWSRFDDPLLSTLVVRALEANTSVKSAQAALRQARASRDLAAAGLLPAVGASASAGHSTTGRHDSSTSYRAGFDASWELDVFGGNRSALAASEAAASASAASLGDVQVSIAAEVALAYITLRNAQARLAIANDNLAGQLEILQITQWRLQAGLVTSLEAEQARSGTEQTSAQLPALQTVIEQAGHALAVLTGRPPAALSAELVIARPVPRASDDLALVIPAEALRQRPDVRAAEHRVDAAAARVAQADAARLPSFRLSGSLGLSALALGSLTNGASVVSALLAGVSMPIFDGGAALAQVRAQEAALDQEMAAYEATLLAALRDVEDALIALRGDRQRLSHLTIAAEAAGNAALLARHRYGSGLVDFQVVLDTQRAQLNTQDGVASASADLSADHVRLYKALGGGWIPGAESAARTTPDDASRTSPS